MKQCKRSALCRNSSPLHRQCFSSAGSGVLQSYISQLTEIPLPHRGIFTVTAHFDPTSGITVKIITVTVITLGFLTFSLPFLWVFRGFPRERYRSCHSLCSWQRKLSGCECETQNVQLFRCIKCRNNSALLGLQERVVTVTACPLPCRSLLCNVVAVCCTRLWGRAHTFRRRWFIDLIAKNSRRVWLTNATPLHLRSVTFSQWLAHRTGTLLSKFTT